MCMSLRGGTYYGASVHITIGFLFLGGFFTDLLGIAEIWHNPYATYVSLCLAFIYICLFIVFGLLIFRGAETESGKLLKGSIAGFVALQISAFFVNLIILAITYSIKKSKNARLPNPAPTLSSDLTEIEAILEEASVELRLNQSVEIIPELESFITSTPSPLDLTTSTDYNQPIISIYQVAIIIVGGIATFLYSWVVILYFRQVNTDTRIRGSRY